MNAQTVKGTVQHFPVLGIYTNEREKFRWNIEKYNISRSKENSELLYNIYTNVTQRVSPISNNNQSDQYRALIEKFVQLGPNDWPKFQQLKKTTLNRNQIKTKRTHNKYPYHCPKNIYRKLLISN